MLSIKGVALVASTYLCAVRLIPLHLCCTAAQAPLSGFGKWKGRKEKTGIFLSLCGGWLLSVEVDVSPWGLSPERGGLPLESQNNCTVPLAQR
jgi:hypothetical protein